MILINKFVLSSYDFNAGISLMFYQNLISVIIVSILSFLDIISTEPLTWRLVKVWFPVNVIFVGMLITSMFSKHHDSRVWAALFLMIISAISGGITDLSFHAVGYAWQIINCFLTESYSLTQSRLMDTAKQVTKSGNLNEFSMVLLNNTLSLPLGILLIFIFNEVDYLRPEHVVRSAVGFAVFTAILSSWALSFAIGRERLFGPVWDQLVMYNLAERLGLTGWS